MRQIDIYRPALRESTFTNDHLIFGRTRTTGLLAWAMGLTITAALVAPIVLSKREG